MACLFHSSLWINRFITRLYRSHWEDKHGRETLTYHSDARQLRRNPAAHDDDSAVMRQNRRAVQPAWLRAARPLDVMKTSVSSDEMKLCGTQTWCSCFRRLFIDIYTLHCTDCILFTLPAYKNISFSPQGQKTSQGQKYRFKKSLKRPQTQICLVLDMLSYSKINILSFFTHPHVFWIYVVFCLWSTRKN